MSLRQGHGGRLKLCIRIEETIIEIELTPRTHELPDLLQSSGRAGVIIGPYAASLHELSDVDAMQSQSYRTLMQLQ